MLLFLECVCVCDNAFFASFLPFCFPFGCANSSSSSPTNSLHTGWLIGWLVWLVGWLSDTDRPYRLCRQFCWFRVGPTTHQFTLECVLVCLFPCLSCWSNKFVSVWFVLCVASPFFGSLPSHQSSLPSVGWFKFWFSLWLCVRFTLLYCLSQLTLLFIHSHTHFLMTNTN